MLIPFLFDADNWCYMRYCLCGRISFVGTILGFENNYNNDLRYPVIKFVRITIIIKLIGITITISPAQASDSFLYRADVA